MTVEDFLIGKVFLFGEDWLFLWLSFQTNNNRGWRIVDTIGKIIYGGYIQIFVYDLTIVPLDITNGRMYDDKDSH